MPTWACCVAKTESGDSTDFDCSNCSSCVQHVGFCMGINNKEAQNVIKGALTCCDQYLPAGETCSTCGGAPKVYCSCIRCNEKCETKTFTAVPAVEKKKLRSKNKKEEHKQLEAHVRKNFSKLPEDMVSEMAKVPDSALAQLPAGVQQRFGMSEEMLSNLD